MKLTEKIIDSTTGLKMKSGSIVEIHVIQNEQNDEKSLGWRLALDYGLALAAIELAWLDSTLNRLSQQPLPVEVVQGN